MTTEDDTITPSTPTPASDTATARAHGPVWTGRRWARPAAAGVGLVLIGGLGGFAVGHATSGGDELAPTSFQPGRQGGSPGQGTHGRGTPPQGAAPGASGSGTS